MKKILYLSSLVLMTLLCFFLTGCKNDTTLTDTESNTTVTTGNVDPVNNENFIQSDKKISTTKLVTYDGPSILESSGKVDVSVNGENLFVYETRVNNARRFSWEYSTDHAPLVIFDFEGVVHIEIKVKEVVTVESATVSPLAYGIKPEIENNTISFDLNYTGNYVVEYNGDYKTAIHIFGNPIEEDPITAEEAALDPSIIYLGPGVYNAGAIPTNSNSTIYLAGGAYVYGQLGAEGAENITIRGRGIISGEIYQRRNDGEYTIPVVLRKCSNITIEGVTFLDPAGWVINLYKCSDVKIDNIKIISARANSDGISVQSCENVDVTGGFIRTWDDSLVVKNKDGGETHHITFDGVVVWTDLAQSMEVGYETYGAVMDDINFLNITVVHNFHKAVISIHNCDDADITNVTYKNITIEDAETLGDVRDDNENDFLIDFTIAYNETWTASQGLRGTISKIKIENVKVLNILDSIVCRMAGESLDSSISDIEITGVEIEGKKISSTDDLKLITNQYVSNVSVTSTEKTLGAYITLPYSIEEINSEVSKTKVEGVSQSGLLVPSFSHATGGLSYIGEATKLTSTISATHGAGNKTNTPYDDNSGDYTLSSSSASYAFDQNDKTIWVSKEWKNEDSEFVALTFDFEESKEIGVIRIKGDSSNPFFYVYSIQVWGRKIKADGTMNANYTRLISLKDYQMTPAKNNIIDINITAQEYGGLQLRMYRVDGITSPTNYEISEVEFYSPSLTFNKAIVSSTAHNDVYNVEKLVDGDPTGTSYYESVSFPAEIVIDLDDVYHVNTIVLYLPPSLLWTARIEELEIDISSSNFSYTGSETFTTAQAKTAYTFDPTSGNRVTINFDTPIEARYLKITIYSNSASGGYCGQLSEISAYGYK